MTGRSVNCQLSTRGADRFEKQLIRDRKAVLESYMSGKAGIFIYLKSLSRRRNRVNTYIGVFFEFVQRFPRCSPS